MPTEALEPPPLGLDSRHRGTDHPAGTRVVHQDRVVVLSSLGQALDGSNGGPHRDAIELGVTSGEVDRRRQRLRRASWVCAGFLWHLRVLGGASPAGFGGGGLAGCVLRASLAICVGPAALPRAAGAVESRDGARRRPVVLASLLALSAPGVQARLDAPQRQPSRGRGGSALLVEPMAPPGCPSPASGAKGDGDVTLRAADRVAL